MDPRLTKIKEEWNEELQIVEVDGQRVSGLRVKPYEDFLGKGAFGTVYRVKRRDEKNCREGVLDWIANECEFQKCGLVLKVPHSGNQKAKDSIEKELYISGKIGRHPHLVTGTRAIVRCPREVLCMLMPYSGISLGDIFEESHNPNVHLKRDHATVARFIRDMQSAYEILKFHEIENGDIRADNVLFRGYRELGTEAFAICDWSLGGSTNGRISQDPKGIYKLFSKVLEYVYRVPCKKVSDEKIRVLGMEIFRVLHELNDEHRPAR